MDPAPAQVLWPRLLRRIDRIVPGRGSV